MPPQAASPQAAKSGQAAMKNIILILALLVVLVGAAYAFTTLRKLAIVEVTTPYQAVLLRNGSAYFGKLEGLGTPNPVLKEVFYVQSAQDPQTKQVSNILVKRGKE